MKALRTNISQSLSMEQALDLHEKFQRLQPMVHAEVQVITYLLQNGSNVVFPCLGTSAKPCFMCHHFAQQFRFETRDPVFNQHSVWKVPEVPDLSCKDVELLVRATCAVAGDMKSQLLMPIEAGVPNQGGGSGSSDAAADEEFKSCVISFLQVGHANLVNERLGNSFNQMNTGSLLHRLNRTYASSGYSLYEAAERDEMPTDTEVLQGYGFLCFAQPRDRKMLLGLYRDLAYTVITPSDVNQGRAKGRLVEKDQGKVLAATRTPTG